MTERRRVVSVIGDARIEDPARLVEAQRLGAALMAAGFRIVTGGLGGLMSAVSEGARGAPEWEEGRILGIVPTYRREDANPFCDVVIPTGMQIGRNILVVASGDVVLAVGGGSGTLSELAVAWQLGRPIVALGDHGWAGRLAGQRLDERCEEPIHACASVEAAVAACLALSRSPTESGDIGSGAHRRRKGSDGK